MEADAVAEDVTQDIYTDSSRFTISAYGVAFTFGLNPPHPEARRPAVAKELIIVRMSLENAKVLAMLLRSNLKNYEMTNGLEIALPAQVYTQLGIAREDWQ